MTDHPPTPASATAAFDFSPLRLAPGADLRRALEDHAASRGAAFVVAGIGSLISAQLRFAAAAEATRLDGPLEILAVSGSLSDRSAHLHMSVADASGRVIGGHVDYGSLIRTTAEVLLVWLPAWRLSRALDPATG